MNREILVIDGRLREISEPVIIFDETTKQLVEDLKETAIGHNGLGLSAIQIGEAKRVIVIQDQASQQFIPFINPEITALSPSYQGVIDGCLSFPGIYKLCARPMSVGFKYQTIDGEEKEQRLESIEAFIFLHEYDHLNGIVFMDRAFNYSERREFKRRNKFKLNHIAIDKY